MGVRHEIRHRMGTVAIEGGEVVVRLEGQRRTRLLGPVEPWGNTIRVALAQASVTVAGNEVVIRRDGAAVQAVHCDDPVGLAAFVEALEDAKRRLAKPTSACTHCGAPGQVVGLACGYCGHAVATPPAAPGS